MPIPSSEVSIRSPTTHLGLPRPSFISMRTTLGEAVRREFFLRCMFAAGQSEHFECSFLESAELRRFFSPPAINVHGHTEGIAQLHTLTDAVVASDAPLRAGSERPHGDGPVTPSNLIAFP